MPNFTPLTLIGKSGEGKSTTANHIVGSHLFPTSSGIKSCTSTISRCDVPNAEITIYDTPGLGDTDGRSEEFFQQITDHLYEHGGVIAFVQSQSRVDQRVKNHLKALSLVLEGLPFSSCCVLITTKLNNDPFLSDEENVKQCDKYQQDLEKECFKAAGRGAKRDLFARRYAYSTLLPNSLTEFVKAIKADVPGLRGIASGTVLTWGTIIQLSENRVIEASTQRTLLANEVTRLESVIATIQYNMKWHQACIFASDKAGPLLIKAHVAVLAVGTIALQVAKHISQLALEQLETQLQVVEKDLQEAKDNLRTLNMSALEAKARRIRELVA